jgi:hypothetical protein
MTKVWAIIEIIKAVIGIIKDLINMRKNQVAKEASEKQENLEKAVDESKVAQTDEEVWNAQDKIIKNKP